MKTVKPYTLFYIACFIIASVCISCTPDKEDDPSSPSPNTDARDKYIGSWLCNETSKVS